MLCNQYLISSNINNISLQNKKLFTIQVKFVKQKQGIDKGQTWSKIPGIHNLSESKMMIGNNCKSVCIMGSLICPFDPRPEKRKI